MNQRFVSEDFIQSDILNEWVDENEPPEVVNRRYIKLTHMMEPLYQFVLRYSYYLNSRRDYGKENVLTMLEAHVLTEIVDQPGITVTDIAAHWKRSTSSISQVVTRLVKWGYVAREVNADNAKVYNLIPSERATEFVDIHKRYDNKDIVKTNKRLAKEFTADELSVFYSIINRYSEMLEETHSASEK